MAIGANPEIQAALRRLLVTLERPGVMQEWQHRGPRKDVAADQADRSEKTPKAA